MPDYTTAALLKLVRQRAMLPTTGSTLDNEALLQIANEELSAFIVPLLVATCEEYLVAYVDVPISGDREVYPIPPEAVGGVLRDLVLVQAGREAVSLERYEPERLSWQKNALTEPGYTLQGNEVRLVGLAPGADTLRFVIYKRPSTLVETGRAAMVTSANPAVPSVTVAAVPAALQSATRIDMVSARPGFDSILTDAAVTLSGVTWNLEAGLTNQLSARPPKPGDYVCLPGESPLPQIPAELHPLLVLRTAFSALEFLGDPRARLFEERCERMKISVVQMLRPRTRGTGRVVINPNAPGMKTGLGRRTIWRR